MASRNGNLPISPIREQEHAMKVKRIEHVAIAVRSLAKAREIFEDKLGLTIEYEEHLPQYNTKLAMLPVGQTYIELLESDRPDSETSKWISENGEGLFHICLEVENIDAALAELKGKGVKLIDETPRLGHANSRIAFLDPRSTNNVVIELVELAHAEAAQPTH
jgi:methylmalonyl-CoA/ethylmalonyl-CoA epimerase